MALGERDLYRSDGLEGADVATSRAVGVPVGRPGDCALDPGGAATAGTVDRSGGIAPVDGTAPRAKRVSRG